MDLLRAFFSKTEAERGVNIEGAEFRLLHRERNEADSQKIREFENMERLLGLEDIIVPEESQRR